LSWNAFKYTQYVVGASVREATRVSVSVREFFVSQGMIPNPCSLDAEASGFVARPHTRMTKEREKDDLFGSALKPRGPKARMNQPRGPSSDVVGELRSVRYLYGTSDPAVFN
jgi:hypothetical protein